MFQVIRYCRLAQVRSKVSGQVRFDGFVERLYKIVVSYRSRRSDATEQGGKVLKGEEESMCERIDAGEEVLMGQGRKESKINVRRLKG